MEVAQCRDSCEAGRESQPKSVTFFFHKCTKYRFSRRGCVTVRGCYLSAETGVCGLEAEEGGKSTTCTEAETRVVLATMALLEWRLPAVLERFSEFWELGETGHLRNCCGLPNLTERE